MTSPLLQVKNLRKYFPASRGLWGQTTSRVHAVDNVSFSLKAGQTLGLVGESGCGKSTLGRTILRLHEPSSGDVLFEGQSLLALSRAELRGKRKDLQIIFQDPYASLNPHMRIGEILSEPFLIQGLDHARQSGKALKDTVLELLERVGLPANAYDRFPHEFSGGQRQRVGIARAVALRPKLVVADEPVSALDVSIQSQILNLLADLRDDLNLSYVFIAHDLAVIKHISDQIAVMYLGKIVEYASADEIYTSPQHPYTKALIDAIPSVSGKRQRQLLEGDVPSPIHPPAGCRFHTRCPFAKDLCRQEAPELRSVDSASDRLVSCHFAGEALG